MESEHTNERSAENLPTAWHNCHTVEHQPHFPKYCTRRWKGIGLVRAGVGDLIDQSNVSQRQCRKTYNKSNESPAPTFHGLIDATKQKVLVGVGHSESKV